MSQRKIDSAKNCGDPSSILAQVNQGYEFSFTAPATTYPNKISVVCINGYIWEDRQKSKFIVCESNGIWNIPPLCDRI